MLMLFVCMLHTNHTKAQNKSVADSLWKILNYSTSPKERFLSNLNLARYYAIYNLDSLKIVLENASVISNQIQDNTQKPLLLSFWGYYYTRIRDFDNAILYYEKCLNVVDSSKHQKMIPQILSNLGSVYLDKQIHDKSLYYYQKALKLFSQNKENNTAIVLKNIATLYDKQENRNYAIEYYQKAILEAQRFKDKNLEAICLKDLGSVYNDMGKIETAFLYIEKSLKIFIEINNIREIASCYLHFAHIYNNKNDLQNALNYYQKALDLGEKIGVNNASCVPLQGISNIYLKQNNLPKAEEYSLKAFDIAKKNKLPLDMKEACRTLYLIKKRQNQNAEALQYFEDFKNISDTLLNKEKIQKIAQLETNFQVSQKQNEINILNLNKTLLEKDNQLQKIENERQKNAKLALQKQAEADRLSALARQEKDKRKQDSLFTLAQRTQLEADNLKIKEKQLETETKNKTLEILKEKQAKELQQNINYLIFGILFLLIIAIYLVFQNMRKERKAKKMIEQQKDKIAIQAQNLEEVNQWKDKIFGIIAHDLRSPLAGFQSVGRQISTYLKKNNLEKIEKIGNVVEQNAKKVSGILDNLLHWAMLQTQGIRLFPTKILLYDFTQNFIKDIENINVQNLIPKDFIIETDEIALSVILRNIINNAQKYTPNDGNIWIEIKNQKQSNNENNKEEKKTSQICISISNTGEGISPEKLKNLFTQKVQSQQGLQGQEGTGIGLMLCQSFAEKMNGRIIAESILGQKTTFNILLPHICEY